MKKIFLIIFLSIFAAIATGCMKGKDAEKDKPKVPFSIENRITELVEGATTNKKIQQEMREELRFLTNKGYFYIGTVSIRYDSLFEDFEYRYEGDIFMRRSTVHEIMNRKYGIYFEDKKTTADILEVRDNLYDFFEQLSPRVVLKEETIPTPCPTGCKDIIYRMYPVSKNDKFNSYQFTLVDLVVHSKTLDTLSVSFQHLDFYTLMDGEIIEDAQEVRAEFMKIDGQWTMSSISVYEPYERFNMSGELYFPKDSILLNR